MGVFEKNKKDQVADNRTGPVAEALLEVKEGAQKIRKPYTKRIHSNEDTESKARQEKIQKDLDAIFQPELWEPLVSLPADLMLAITGEKDIWNLSEKDIKSMSVSTNVAMKYAGITDPKWFAIMAMTVAISRVYAPRTVKHFANEREIRRLQAAKQV